MSEHPQLDADTQHRPEQFERARGEWPHPHDHSAQLHRAILHDLRSAGPSSPDEVGRRVGTSRTSALQQLRALETAGLARHATVKHGVGRPRHVYDLTPGRPGPLPGQLRRPRDRTCSPRSMPSAARSSSARSSGRAAKPSRSGPAIDWPTGCRPAPRSSTASASSRSSRTRPATCAARPWTTTERRSTCPRRIAPSSGSPPATRAPAPPSSRCSRTSWAPMSSASRTSCSGDRCCSYRISESAPD